MSWGRFAVRTRRPGAGWRLELPRFGRVAAADLYESSPEFADVDTQVVELAGGNVVVIRETLAFEKRMRRAS